MCHRRYLFFFFNDTATTEIYTLSLHDALPICERLRPVPMLGAQHGLVIVHAVRHLEDAVRMRQQARHQAGARRGADRRSEEHTSELQSRQYLVCRLLLEKKKKPRTLQAPTTYF